MQNIKELKNPKLENSESIFKIGAVRINNDMVEDDPLNSNAKLSGVLKSNKANNTKRVNISPAVSPNISPKSINSPTNAINVHLKHKSTAKPQVTASHYSPLEKSYIKFWSGLTKKQVITLLCD